MRTNVKLAGQEHNEIHIIPKTQLSQKDECEDVQRMDKMIDFLQ